MTATGAVYFLDNGIKRPINLEERLLLSHLEGYDLNAFLTDGKPIPADAKVRLLGNMVQIPFAQAMLEHVRKVILGL
jgi:hypothetical protein